MENNYQENNYQQDNSLNETVAKNADYAFSRGIASVILANIPIGYNGFKTRSCHTFDEIKSYKNEYDYLFLSPIFDSISKVGYKSSFSKEELEKASEEGIIDEKVVALGGVTFDVIPYLKELNFGGVAMLGGIYNIEALKYLKKYKDIQTTII